MFRIKKFRIAWIKFAKGRTDRDKNVKNRSIKWKIKEISVETLVACPIKYKSRLDKSSSLNALLKMLVLFLCCKLLYLLYIIKNK